jgi:hypothetical protein
MRNGAETSRSDSGVTKQHSQVLITLLPLGRTRSISFEFFSYIVQQMEGMDIKDRSRQEKDEESDTRVRRRD